MEAVRRAAPDDVDRMVELFADAVSEMSPLRGGQVFVAREVRSRPGEDDIRAAVSDPARFAVVGTFDDVVVGYAIGAVEDLRSGVRLGRFTDLYVDPQARGVGVGEGMMQAALEWFRAQGCGAVDGYALPGDRSTKNFFEASGFSARLLVMHTRLSP